MKILLVVFLGLVLVFFGAISPWMSIVLSGVIGFFTPLGFFPGVILGVFATIVGKMIKSSEIGGGFFEAISDIAGSIDFGDSGGGTDSHDWGDNSGGGSE